MGSSNVSSFIKIAVREILKCGMETHPEKGIISTKVSDYLKIRTEAGRLSPNNYAQLFGSENVGMSDSPQSFMSGQLQKGDLVVSRGADPNVVFRFGLLLFLIRCSYRVGIRGSSPDFSHIYYPPMSMWFTPTSMGGLGRAPFPFPFAGDPAISLWINRDPEIMNYILERASSLKSRQTKDYTSIIAGLIMNSGSRSDFKITSNTSPLHIPLSDLSKPFGKGVSEMSASLDVSAIRRSQDAFAYLTAKNVRLVSAEMTYPNAPKRFIKNVISSNSSVMAFSHDKSKTISPDSFVGAKVPQMSDTEKWLCSFNITIEPSTGNLADMEGPLCFLHPTLIPIVSHAGFGATSRDTQRGIASLLNTIKTDPLFPRDITDEGIMRLLFSQEILEDPNTLPAVLMAVGCTEDTVAKVVSMFSDTAVNAVLLQYISGTFTLNTPMFQMLNRSQKNVSRYITDLSDSKQSKTAKPALYAYWNFLTHAYKRPVKITYENTVTSIKLSTKIEPLNIIPFTPILEAERMRSEHRAPVNTPFGVFG